MKIGIYDSYLDTLSGGEKYMLSAAVCLAEEHEVFIFWDEESEIRKRAEEKLGISLKKVKFSKNIFSKNTFFLTRFFSTLKYDAIFYLSDGSIPLIYPKLFLHFQFPVEWVKANSWKSKLKMKRVEKIISNSFFTKRFIDKKFNLKSIVIYPPVQIKMLKKFKKENIILNVGRFSLINGSNFKKQDLIIDVFRKLIEENLKGWRLILVTSVLERDLDRFEELKKKAINLPVDFVVNAKDSLLWEIYAKSKIYWHATGFGEDLNIYPEKAEHFGISTVEAMGAGVVPVVINAGGQIEIVNDGKNGFLWNKTEELLKKTKLLIEKNDLLEKMSVEAMEKAKVFSQEKYYQKIKEIFNNG